MILTAEARKAHRAPAPDVELMHRILVALAGHSSKRPARSIDLRVTAGARSHRTRGEADALRARIAAAVQGKPQQDGLTVKQLAATLGVTAAAISHLIKDSPRIARAPACGKPPPGKKPDVVFDPFAEEVTA